MIHRDDLQIRDPFIFPMHSSGRYYLFGTTDLNPWNERGVGFNAYVSEDLLHFEGPFQVFRPESGFWGTVDFWAPEVHSYHGRYYMFATFTSKERRRGTQILSADSILGPYEPLVNRAVTPPEWECLDGTLFVDEEGDPWIVFCHEWVQVHNGSVCAMRLSEDLTEAISEPQVLFRAGEAPWPAARERRDGSGKHDAYVTDGPFLHRISDGSLIMLWSSTGETGYAMGQARSMSGTILGPWEHSPTPLISGDGGHGMVFRDFEGRLKVTYHTPNTTPQERFFQTEVAEEAGFLVRREEL